MPRKLVPDRKRERFLVQVTQTPGLRISVLSREYGYLFIRHVLNLGDIEIRDSRVYPAGKEKDAALPSVSNS
jgi:hypothetical protein